MIFLIKAENKAGTADLRAQHIAAHVDYLNRFKDRFVGSGPMVTDDGETVNGTIMILDMPSRDALDHWLAQEPYHAAGIYGSIEIRRWRFGKADTNRRDRDFQ